MRTSRRSWTSCALLVAVLLAGTVPGLARAEDAASSTGFVGLDGQVHDPAPLIIDGIDGQLFYGPDLDLACRVGGEFVQSMTKLSRLARKIERSGRTVVFTVAPAATSIISDRVGVFPHGRCDRRGVAAQTRVLDRYADPAYLPLRPWLSGQHRQMYWKTDLHWTTVGGARFAKALATKLDPRLGRLQRYRYATETRVGLLNEYAGRVEPETVPTASPAGRVDVRDAEGSSWSGYPEFTFRTSWVSSPKSHTWPGRTLVLGDSFAWYALENLRPIFGRGEFLWFTHAKEAEILQSIERADTVVIETYQLVTPRTPIAKAAFLRKLEKTLTTEEAQ
jgi:hypothetical protein